LEILRLLKQYAPAVFVDLVINPATLTVEKSVDFQ